LLDQRTGTRKTRFTVKKRKQGTLTKQVVNDKLKKLPEPLESLEHEKRLNIICKLLPFVCPKVETVSHKEDELNYW
jgi:hypothetical protein